MTSFAEGQPREDHLHGARPDDSAELYRLLVATVRDYAIFALDASGHVLTWNAGAKHLKGYEASEIIGRQFSVFYPPEDVEAGKPRDTLANTNQLFLSCVCPLMLPPRSSRSPAVLNSPHWLKLSPTMR